MSLEEQKAFLIVFEGLSFDEPSQTIPETCKTFFLQKF